MEKAKEIELLQSLKGDTYFAQLFGDEQIDAMCENIRNDYPIECGIQLFQESQVARENVNLKAKLTRNWELAETAAKGILTKASEYHDEALEDVAERLVGRNTCLRIKLHFGLPLSEDDREEIIKLIEQ